MMQGQAGGAVPQGMPLLNLAFALFSIQGLSAQQQALSFLSRPMHGMRHAHTGT